MSEQPSPSARGASGLRTSPLSPTMDSCPTARTVAWSPRTARSSGCACRDRTRRAFSGRCWTAPRGRSGSARLTSTSPISAICAGIDGARDDLAYPDGVVGGTGFSGHPPLRRRGAPARLPAGADDAAADRDAGPAGHLYRREGRDRGRLCSSVHELRSHPRQLELRRRGLPVDDDSVAGIAHADHDQQHRAGRVGGPLLRANHPGGG